MQRLDNNIRNIYESAKEKCNEIHLRKQHIEIKILYLLQAAAVLGGLDALKSVTSGSNEAKYFENIVKYSYIASYIFLALSVIILVQALNDNLLNRKIIRMLIMAIYKIDVDEYGYTYKEMPFADKMLEEYIGYKKNKKYNNNINEYYEGIIKAINRAARLGYNISIAKNLCFTLGLYLFVSAVILKLISVFLNFA